MCAEQDEIVVSVEGEVSPKVSYLLMVFNH